MWWEEAEHNMNESQQTSRQDQRPAAVLLPDARKELLGMYSELFAILLARKLPLSGHEVDDFDQVRRSRLFSMTNLIRISYITGIRQIK